MKAHVEQLKKMIAYKREALKGYEGQPEAEQRRRAEVIEVANVAITVLTDFMVAVKIHSLGHTQGVLGPFNRIGGIGTDSDIESKNGQYAH